MIERDDLPSYRWTRAIVLTASGAVVVLGLATLLGWMFDVELLRSFLHPNHVSMNPVSAAALALLASGLALLESEPVSSWRRRAGIACAAAVLIVALLRLAGIPVDHLLFPSRTNEMSLNSAVNFALLGLTLCLLDVTVAQLHIAQLALFVAAGVTLLSLTGYLYGVVPLYRIGGGFKPMAVNTAVAFGALCIGILFARPRREPTRMLLSDTLGGAMTRRLLPAAFVLPMTLGWLAYRGERGGWFDSDVRLCLLVLGNIVVFNALVWWTAKIQRRTDFRRRLVEEELRQNEERYRAITEQAAEGIYLVDVESRRIIDCNAALERLLGYQHGELKGMTVYTLIEALPENIDARLLKLAQTEGALRGQRRYRHKDGSSIEVETSATMVSYGGRRVACTVVYDITERKEAEEALRASENRLRLVIETANDAFIAMDEEGKIVDWNPQAERTFGWLLDEAIGRVVAETIIPERYRVLHNRGLESFLKTGHGPVFGQRLELVALHRDGHEFPIDLAVSAARVGDKHVFFAFVHDITARKQAEEERDRFFTLSSDIVAVAGFDGYFKRVNPSFSKTLGYDDGELLVKPWLDFVHPDDIAPTIAQGEKLAQGDAVLSFENRYRCKDGTYKWLAWMSVPVVKDQKIYAIARDMTERKRIEQELLDAAKSEREAHHKLRDAQSQLVQAEKLAGLGQMVAGVAHEINNPLSFVSNNVAVIERDLAAIVELIKLYRKAEQTPEVKAEIAELSARVDLDYTLPNVAEIITRSREGLRRIYQIVKDLRDFARLDQSDLQETDLNAGIESTINIIRGRAKKKQVQIETDLGQIPLVQCYPAKINQVVMNLLANAIDASHEGGRVTVRTHRDDDLVKIEVIDEGCGIDSATCEKIFDPFFTTKPVGEGTGLGLSISYGIVEDHGGMIRVESEKGKGTKFVVKLPKTFRGGNAATNVSS